MAAKSTRRETLGAFLRSRRERLRPEALGLKTSGRRRTPGLRRQEVCKRAKLGLSWYTWMEQGREVAITADTLLDVTFALALDDDETAYVFELAQLQPPRLKCGFTIEVPGHLQTMIDCMELTPAYVINGRWDRIAWNSAAVQLLGDLSQEVPERRNTIWKTFNNPDAPHLVENWDEFAQIMLAEFHACHSRFLQEPWMEEFVQDLIHSSPKFADWWSKHDIRYRRDKRLVVKRDGEYLTFQQSSFHVSAYSDLAVVVFTPDPTTSTLEWVKRVNGYPVMSTADTQYR